MIPAGSSVAARGLSKAFGELMVLDGVTFDISPGERVALLGKSGSGKSTLLHLMAGLDAPTSGSVAVDGVRVDSLGRDALALYRNTTVGLIFQSFHLVPDRNAWQNVELPLIFAGVKPAERRSRSREILEGVGLGGRLDHRPAELSGGERQRVAIARSLVTRPRFLLADEPTGNLDSRTAAEIMALIRDHLDRHPATLVLVTHDAELARGCATRTLHIRDGRISGDEARDGLTG